MVKLACHSIRDTISEFAALLTTKANCPDLLGKLMAFSESPNLSCHAVGEKVVEDLVEIADNSKSYSIFKAYLANFIQALFAIARASEFKDGVRQMAVEVLLCIIEVEDMRMYLNIPEFTFDFVPMLLKLKLKAVDDGDCIDQDNAAINADKARDYDVSEKSLSRVASEIGYDDVKNIIFGYISEYLKRDEWQYKLVAIMAIKETVDNLHEEGINTLLDEIMEKLIVQLNNQHDCIRAATCQAIHQVAENEFLFQKRYAKMTLPLIVNMFNDPSPSVQYSAVAAFNSIARGTVAADLIPFADPIVEKLLELIKPENPRRMQEQCMEGFGVVAYVVGKEFMKYYTSVIPVIVGIIVTSSTKEERVIRGKAIKSFNTIMRALLDDADDLEDDDLLKENIQKTFRQMCLILKGEFAPYLPHLVPSILKVLNIDSQPDNQEEMDEEEEIEVGRSINLLLTFIEVLGPQFGDYLVPAAQSLLPLLSFPLSSDVKYLALTAIANIFTIARESSDSATRQMLNLWVTAVVEKVLRGLTSGDDDAGVKTAGLSKCLRNAGPDVLNAQQVEAICQKFLHLVEELNQRCPKSISHYPELYLRSALFELIEVVISFHADLYLQTGAKLCSKFIETHLDLNCSSSDRALALCVVDTVLEHLKDKSAPLWPTFASRLVECIGDPDPVVRQAAAYGVIQAAKCSQFPVELIQKAAAQLFALLNAMQSQEEDFLDATDSMIAALGTIIVHRSDCCLQPSPEQYINLWISNLPLNVDYKEGCRTHGDLVDLLVQRSPEVLGPQNANLPKLLPICASIYQTEFTTKKTDEGIREFMQNIDFDVISSVGAILDEDLQKKLKRINRDRQT